MNESWFCSRQDADASEKRKIQAEEAYADALNFFTHGDLRQAQVKIFESTELWSENKIFQSLKTRIAAAVDGAQASTPDVQAANSLNRGSKSSEVRTPVYSIEASPVAKPPVDDGWIGAYAGERHEIQIQGASYGFCYCPPGTFMMGSSDSEEEQYAHELTHAVLSSELQHKVTLTRGFWMLETPVTQRLWTSIMGKNPSVFCKTGYFHKRVKRMDTTDFPVECVSWYDCQEFIEKLNGFNLIPGHKFRLPTEAEWEYACRAGTKTAYWWGDSLNGDYANCNGNYPYGTKRKGKYLERTCAVKNYKANPWGLYDVHGNVLEWCSDGYGDYPDGDVIDPEGDDGASLRVLRGGSWDCYAEYCRSAIRSSLDPVYWCTDVCFRLLFLE